MKKPKMVWMALASVLCASAALADVIYVNADSVDIRSGASGLYPVTAKAPRGTELTVLNHQGKWVQVQSGTITGFVFEDAVSPNKPGIDVLATLNLKPTVTSGDAGKGLTPTATTFAQGKNLNPKPLDDLIAFRTHIDPKEWETFCIEGQIGPNKPPTTMPTTQPTTQP